MLCAVLHCTLRRKQWLYSNKSDFGSVLLQLSSKMKSVNTEWWQITTPKISYLEINIKTLVEPIELGIGLIYMYMYSIHNRVQ